ncbi:MAG: hypothetical protein WD341_06075 [Tistlia sp.]|uniref:hypothetical protein n=1 Tax=Tistlia sp. TaxID=3057121 RepID=UPI0034A3EEF0
MSDAFSEVLAAFGAAAATVPGIATLATDPRDPVPPARLPALELRSGGADPLEAATGRDGWAWELIVTLAVGADVADDLGALLRPLTVATAKALLADPTLGGKVADLRWTGCSAVTGTSEGSYVASIDLLFTAEFETAEDDPTQLI